MIFAADCLAGRHILVTGASSGIGQATAVKLSRSGARLSLVGRNMERLESTRRRLDGVEHSVHAIDLDLIESTSEAVVAIGKDRGVFDGMFHSAGSTLVLPLRLLKDRHFDEVFGAGVRGAFGLVKAAARKGVMTDGGSIVLMSSVAAVRGRPALAAYCAAKAAVDALAMSAALELAPRKIRVNAIRAAAVETPLHEDYMASIGPDAIKDYQDRHPLGFGQPDDVASQVLFLLSDGAHWITGTSIAVDGGALAR